MCFCFRFLRRGNCVVLLVLVFLGVTVVLLIVLDLIVVILFFVVVLSLQGFLSEFLFLLLLHGVHGFMVFTMFMFMMFMMFIVFMNSWLPLGFRCVWCSFWYSWSFSSYLFCSCVSLFWYSSSFSDAHKFRFELIWAIFAAILFVLVIDLPWEKFEIRFQNGKSEPRKTKWFLKFRTRLWKVHNI